MYIIDFMLIQKLRKNFQVEMVHQMFKNLLMNLLYFLEINIKIVIIQMKKLKI